MNKLKLVVAVLVAASLVAAYRGQAAPHPDAEAAADSTAEPGFIARSSAAVTSGLGRLGARVVEPAVRSMIRDTERELAELEPVIVKAGPMDRIEARKLVTRIAAYDSTALAKIAAGEPMAAIRYAVRGKGVIPTVRQTVSEVTAFR